MSEVPTLVTNDRRKCWNGILGTAGVDWTAGPAPQRGGQPPGYSTNLYDAAFVVILYA